MNQITPTNFYSNQTAITEPSKEKSRTEHFIEVITAVKDFYLAPIKKLGYSDEDILNYAREAKKKFNEGALYFPLASLGACTAVELGVRAGVLTPAESLTNLFSRKVMSWDDLLLSQVAIIALSVIAAPMEEALFRGGIQEFFLKRKLKQWFPQYQESLDNEVAKALRIALSTLCFSAYHLQNLYFGFSWKSVKTLLFNTAGMGIVFGYLQEKTGSVWSSAGAHFAHNCITPFLQELTKKIYNMHS